MLARGIDRGTSCPFVPIHRGYVDDTTATSRLQHAQPVLHAERRQDEGMVRRGRAKGRSLPQDRFTELDASPGTRKEHFCMDDLWLKPDGPDAR
jgi:hypothetical protein